MKRNLIGLTLILVLLTLVSGCNLLPGGSGPVNAPAPEMLPDLAGYKVVEGQQLTEYITTLSEGATLLAGQPELAAAVALVDQIVTCYQDVGAVAARVYSDEAFPLSAGAVAIADRDALLDPVNLFRCVGLGATPFGAEESGTPAIQPCTANYTLTKDETEFYIVYAGTTLEICQAFCSDLEGCTAH